MNFAAAIWEMFVPQLPVNILMATHNGALHLGAQLDSLLAQTHSNWSLVVSDDGSTDATWAILRRFQVAHPARRVTLIKGPCQGNATQNFLSLLLRVPHGPGLVALADQDDVWLPQKLARAVDHLARVPQAQPAIYAAESTPTDAKLRPLPHKPQREIQPSFHNALVQNLFAGHSTVLNGAALRLVQCAGAPRDLPFHDWWLYQLVAAAGGTCLLDPAETVLYRQHGRNAFGAAQGLTAAIKRAKHLLRGDYARWLAAHWRALQTAAPHLTPAARTTLCDLLTPSPDESRTAQFRRVGLHRASPFGTAALLLAAWLRRV